MAATHDPRMAALLERLCIGPRDHLTALDAAEGAAQDITPEPSTGRSGPGRGGLDPYAARPIELDSRALAQAIHRHGPRHDDGWESVHNGYRERHR